MSLTQQEIGDHLDLSQKNVSELMKRLSIDWQNATLDQIRIAYIQDLRAKAAGHRTDDGLDLVRERVMTERVDRELKQFTLAEKKKELINVAQLEPELVQMVSAFKTELLGRDDKLKVELDAMYGIDVDLQLLNDHTHAAFSHLARYDAGGTPADRSASGPAGAAGEDQSV